MACPTDFSVPHNPNRTFMRLAVTESGKGNIFAAGAYHHITMPPVKLMDWPVM